ncbi:MAG: hypothetical protein ABSB91_08865 [Sedimentisphaerales bacterium]|jgi:hypothetical protein
MYKGFFVFLFLAVVAGCGNTTTRQPETKGIKIGELAPKSKMPNQPVMQFLQTTNIDIVTYELPAKDINSLDNVWAILPGNTETLRITDPDGFAANGLRVAAGTFGKKNKIMEALKTIKAQKLSTTSLLIHDGQPETLVLGRLTRKSTIAYIARGGAVVNAEAGPAILGLQVYARQITPPTVSGQTPPAQTISRVQITPVISASTEGLPEELAIRMKQQDVRIYSAAFGLNMKPGDIFVLAPTPYKIGDDTAVAGRFLAQNGSEPMIKILLFVCTSII